MISVKRCESCIKAKRFHLAKRPTETHRRRLQRKQLELLRSFDRSWSVLLPRRPAMGLALFMPSISEPHDNSTKKFLKRIQRELNHVQMSRFLAVTQVQQLQLQHQQDMENARPAMASLELELLVECCRTVVQ